MRVVDQSNCVNDIIDLIISKAMYQKVVFCLDDSSDVRLIDTIAKKIERKVSLIKYYYNKNNVDAFNNIVNNGVRVTVYNVSSEHFYVLQNDNSFILNIFIPQSSFVLPYITCGESMYGDNLLVCDMCKKDYISIICMYYLALNRLLELLVNDVEVDTQIFKDVDWLVNCDSGFYSNLINMVKRLRGCLNDCYKEIDEEELPCYVYLQLYSIFKMFDNLNNGEEQYIDFYKSESSSEGIEKAYSLIFKNNIIDTIRFNCINLIKINNAILDRVKLIIKKYFNFKNIKLNKLLKLIKNQSKRLNIDNLLYISYIFNTI